jgi:hypothetical protein
MPDLNIVFASPRKLPRVTELEGRVVVVDIAFASEASGGGFEKVTLPFIKRLGTRLAAWVDHHDHLEHTRFASDPRFVLCTKAAHGACPEMITPEFVAKIGQVQTIVCHTDFDGLASAAKWMRGGLEPYEGCDADARAVDTRMGIMSDAAETIDRAIRARPRDYGLLGLIVRHLSTGMKDASLWTTIKDAAQELTVVEEQTRRAAAGFLRFEPGIAAVDITSSAVRVDKTLLLLLGQAKEKVAMVIDGDTITLATRFDGGVDLLKLLGLSGGMPTRVSVHRNRIDQVCDGLGMKRSEIEAAFDIRAT